MQGKCVVLLRPVQAFFFIAVEVPQVHRKRLLIAVRSYYKLALLRLEQAANGGTVRVLRTLVKGNEIVVHGQLNLLRWQVFQRQVHHAQLVHIRLKAYKRIVADPEPFQFVASHIFFKRDVF